MFNVDTWVSAEFQRLAQVIYDYDNYLRLEMVPVAEQHLLTDKSKVFRIVDTRYNKVVMFADSLANPREILARLFSMDLNKNDVVGLLDAQNAAAEALRNQAWIEKREAMVDFAAFLAKNTKSRWQHGETIRDEHFNYLGPVRKTIVTAPKRRKKKGEVTS